MKEPVPHEWFEPSLHASYLKLLLRYKGVSVNRISQRLQGLTGLRSYLEIHNAFQSFDVDIAHNLAFEFGLDTSISAHGLFGQAAVASENLALAMSIIATYKPTRNNIFHYNWQADGLQGVFSMSPRFDLGHYQAFSTISSLVNLVNISVFLSGKEIIDELELSMPWDLSQYSAFHSIDSIQTKRVKNAKNVSLKIPGDFLYRDNIFSDSRQFELALRGCEEELNIIRGRSSEQVRQMIAYRDSLKTGEGNLKWYTLNEISDKMALSPRTLNRRLKEENTSYGEILEQTRSELASWYLINTDLKIARISEILGYSGDTNFSRTFRKWKSTTPIAYRRLFKV